MSSGDKQASLAVTITSAATKRAQLDEAGRCYRLLHGYGEGLPGVTIDRYQDIAAIRYRPDRQPLLAAIADALHSLADFRLITARERGNSPGAAKPTPTVLAGEMPNQLVVREEAPWSLLLNFRRAGNPGIYLDARGGRDWIAENSRGRRILNLFSFTGTLGIAAATGGARSVIHVDNHGPVLSWAKKNVRLNGLRVDDRDFEKRDVTTKLRADAKAGRRYGGIILDPPPGLGEPAVQTFELARECAPLVADEGWLMCFFHHDPRPRADIEAEVSRATGLSVCWRGASGSDFVEPDETTRLKITAFERR